MMAKEGYRSDVFVCPSSYHLPVYYFISKTRDKQMILFLLQCLFT